MLLNGDHRARQCLDKTKWYLQQWMNECFHPGCQEEGHWVTMHRAGNFTEATAKSIAEKHNRAMRSA